LLYLVALKWHYNNADFEANSLKTKLKRILATWMLATFLGFSYILSGKEVCIPIEKTLAASLAAIFPQELCCFFYTLNLGFITEL
ncbi:hypothetical protein, partial [uncultured Kiloniella sp.]|uniref:hypothetical protein n=1 Tax=uncultured Kiloniella sp. TaxID=1133091 RepID=UPI002636F3C5